MANNLTDRRVVVTGLGVVTPLGHDLETFWKNLISGQCGIDRITAFDATAFDTQIAGEVRNFDPAPAFPSPKDIRRTDRYSQFGVYAGWAALKDSGADLDKLDRDEIGVIIGSGIGGLETTSAQIKVLLERGPGRISPFMIPMLISNMASGLFSMYQNLRGPNFATCSACATANHAIGEAWRTIKMGEAKMMFAGGAEAAIVPIGIGGFCAMKAMSTRNDDPKTSSRPFDKDRDGFVMGEGAGVIVLEELEHAKKRGAKIYCEIAGYGNTADALSPHRAVARRRRRGALHEDGPPQRRAEPRGHFLHQRPRHLHAAGRRLRNAGHQDRFRRPREKNRRQLHQGRDRPHARRGGRGGNDRLRAGHQARHRPADHQLQNPDPECDLDYVPNTAREMKVNAIINNSFGFGGHNASIAAKKFVG